MTREIRALVAVAIEWHARGDVALARRNYAEARRVEENAEQIRRQRRWA